MYLVYHVDDAGDSLYATKREFAMKRLAGGACFVLALVAVYLVSAPHTPLTTKAASQRQGNGVMPRHLAQPSLEQPSGTYDVRGKPTVSAAFIDAVLCQAHSPACGTGAALYRLGIQYEIDPIFALAIFQHESSFGLYGIARVTHGLGNIRCSQGYQCIDGFRAYRTWVAGYNDWYSLIRNLYIDTWGLTTIPAILQRYAPPTENDTGGYIAAVEHAVDLWRSEQQSR
jgi:hypothetical protein